VPESEKRGEIDGGWEEGGGYPTIPPAWVRRVCSLFSRSWLTAPGYTEHAAGLGVTVTAGSVCPVTGRGALSGNIPWVRDIPDIPDQMVW